MEEETTITQTNENNQLTSRVISALKHGVLLLTGSAMTGIGSILNLKRSIDIRRMVEWQLILGESPSSIRRLISEQFFEPCIIEIGKYGIPFLNTEVLYNPSLLIEMGWKYKGEMLIALGATLMVISSILITLDSYDILKSGIRNT